MIFWDVGGALFAGRWVFRDPNMDLRVLIFGAVLPNLIDKPIALVLFPSSFESARILAHSLLFAVVVMAAVMSLTRRGTSHRKRWMALPIGILLHLVLDLPLENEVLWWPFLGVDLPAGSPAAIGEIGGYLRDNPLVIIQELLGLTYLAVLANRVRIADPAVRGQFFRTGRLPA